MQSRSMPATVCAAGRPFYHCGEPEDDEQYGEYGFLAVV
jgi:hypothetical protein